MKYYRVKYGYGKDEFISIEETELRKAISAQIRGGTAIALFKEGSISGRAILSILPDYNRELGLARDYQMNGEDYAQVGRKVQDEYRLSIEEATMEARDQITGGKTPLQLNG